MAEPAFRGRSSDGAGKAAVWGSLESKTLQKNTQKDTGKEEYRCGLREAALRGDMPTWPDERLAAAVA